MIRYGTGGVAARIEAVERLAGLNADVAGSQSSLQRAGRVRAGHSSYTGPFTVRCDRYCQRPSRWA